MGSPPTVPHGLTRQPTAKNLPLFPRQSEINQIERSSNTERTVDCVFVKSYGWYTTEWNGTVEAGIPHSEIRRVSAADAIRASLIADSA